MAANEGIPVADDYDSPWKEAIERCFAEFLAFYFPEVHAQIDWSQPVEFLEQELRSVLHGTEPDKCVVDKLVRVARLGGQHEWVVVHLEIQGQQHAAFAERMFVYHYRLYERYRQPLASLAVLADDRLNWRPESFAYEVFGCQLGLRFPVAKLLDWSGNDARLADSRNPFAIITRAHLATRATRDDPAAREHAKLGLVRDLFRIGLDRQRMVDLFRVIDWMLRLSKERELQFRKNMVNVEEETTMRYVSSIERLAMEEGMEKGMQQGLQQGLQQGVQQGVQQGQSRALSRQLVTRFGPLPDWAQRKLVNATAEDLDAWIDAVLDAESIEDVFASKSRH